jgi:hypothetical protein
MNGGQMMTGMMLSIFVIKDERILGRLPFGGILTDYIKEVVLAIEVGKSTDVTSGRMKQDE